MAMPRRTSRLLRSPPSCRKTIHGWRCRLTDAARHVVCGHIILGDQPVALPDTAADERFVDNPQVIGPEGFRAYAGVPLGSEDGYMVGALCVADHCVRTFSDEDMFDHYWLDGDHLIVYLVDVSGHGVGAALLSTSVMNVLGARALPDIDLRDPAAVLAVFIGTFPSSRYEVQTYKINRPCSLLLFRTASTRSKSVRGSSWASMSSSTCFCVVALNR